jgi:hypothetical protein
LKKNPKFDDVASSEVLKGIRESLGNFAPQLFNANIGRFKQNIVKADGNLFGAYGHNVGMQAAYAMQNGLISEIPTDSEGKVDTGRLKAQLDSVLDGDSEWRAYRKWLSDMSDTIITSFDEASNEDILNAMKAQPASAKTFKLSENGKLTAPAMEYGSISDFHSNKDRLSEDADKATEALGQDFLKWANEISRKSKKNVSDVVKAINSSFEGRYNVNDIAKAFTNNGINLSRSDASALQSLYKQAVELPTQYFEAKTHRGVGFNEVKAVVLPDNTSDKLIEKLEEMGINVLTYEQGNEADRIAKVNSVESAKFSLKDSDYMSAVEKGDMETAQKMVDEKANKYLNALLLPNDADEVGFKYHRGKTPTKTFKRYAVFNVSEDGFRAAYAGNANATPVGVWLDAQNLTSYMSDMVQFDDGTFASYIAGDTGAATNTKFSPEKMEEYGLTGGQRWLMERGGKHSSDVPNFSQMNTKRNEKGERYRAQTTELCLTTNWCLKSNTVFRMTVT